MWRQRNLTLCSHVQKCIMQPWSTSYAGGRSHGSPGKHRMNMESSIIPTTETKTILRNRCEESVMLIQTLLPEWELPRTIIQHSGKFRGSKIDIDRCSRTMNKDCTRLARPWSASICTGSIAVVSETHRISPQINIVASNQSFICSQEVHVIDRRSKI